MGEFKHSRVLFTMDDGRPLRFQMPPCEEKAKLKAVIEHGGGIISSKYEKHSLRLAVPGKKVHEDGALDSKYITDCVLQNKLLSYGKYKLRSGEVLTMDDHDLEPAEAFVSSTEPKNKQGRKKYLLSEDLKIIKYLVEEGVYNVTGGNAAWKKMELLEVVPGHSWQSLRDHYRKHIYPRLHSYHVSPQYIAKLTDGIAESSTGSPPAKRNKYMDMLHFTSHGKTKSPPKAKSPAAKSKATFRSPTGSPAKRKKYTFEESGEDEEDPSPSSNTKSPAKKPSPAETTRSISQPLSPILSDKDPGTQGTTPRSAKGNSQDSQDSQTTFHTVQTTRSSNTSSVDLDDFDKELLQVASPKKKCTPAVNKQLKVALGERVVSGKDGSLGERVRPGGPASVVSGKDGPEEKESKDKENAVEDDDDQGSEEIKMITKKNKSPTTGADRSPRNEVKKAASSTSSTVKAPAESSGIAVSADLDSETTEDKPTKRVLRTRKQVIEFTPSEQTSPSEHTDTDSGNKEQTTTSKPTEDENAPKSGGKFKFRRLRNRIVSSEDETQDPEETPDTATQNTEDPLIKKKTDQIIDSSTKVLEAASSLQEKTSKYFNKSPKGELQVKSQSFYKGKTKGDPYDYSREDDTSYNSMQSDSILACVKRKRSTNNKKSSPPVAARYPEQEDVDSDTSEVMPRVPTPHKQGAQTCSRRVGANGGHSRRVGDNGGQSRKVGDNGGNVEVVDDSSEGEDAADVISRKKANKRDKKVPALGLRAFLMKDSPMDSQQTDPESNDEESQVDPEEFSESVRQIKKLCRVYDMTPAEVLQVCHWVGGQLHDISHFILHGKTAKGLPAWKSEDDQLLLNCDEGGYKTLVGKYGEEGVIHRQLYLDKNRAAGIPNS